MSFPNPLLSTAAPLLRQAAALLVAAAAAAPAAAQLSPGASASGYASGTFAIGCTTCSHYVIEFTESPFVDNGGPGALEAGFAVTRLPDRVASGIPLDYTLGGSASMAASSRFEGVLATPLLGAGASSDNPFVVIVQDPARVPIGIDYYGATATAEALQNYHYTGSQAATYTFTFRYDGTVSDQRASIGGRAGFYGDNLEIALASGGSSVAGSGYNGAALAVDETFSVAMTFNPGDTYTLRASLTASVFGEYATGLVSADAMSTMRVVSITGGDTALLTAELVPVPEPSPALLLAAGLAALRWRSRRR